MTVVTIIVVITNLPLKPVIKIRILVYRGASMYFSPSK